MQTLSPNSLKLYDKAIRVNKELLELAKLELMTIPIYFPLHHKSHSPPQKLPSPKDRAFLDIDNLPAKKPKRRKATDLTEYTERRIAALGNPL